MGFAYCKSTILYKNATYSRFQPVVAMQRIQDMWHLLAETIYADLQKPSYVTFFTLPMPMLQEILCITIKLTSYQ